MYCQRSSVCILGIRTSANRLRYLHTYAICQYSVTLWSNVSCMTRTVLPTKNTHCCFLLNHWPLWNVHDCPSKCQCNISKRQKRTPCVMYDFGEYRSRLLHQLQPCNIFFWRHAVACPDLNNYLLRVNLHGIPEWDNIDASSLITRIRVLSVMIHQNHS